MTHICKGLVDLGINPQVQRPIALILGLRAFQTTSTQLDELNTSSSTHGMASKEAQPASTSGVAPPSSPHHQPRITKRSLARQPLAATPQQFLSSLVGFDQQQHGKASLKDSDPLVLRHLAIRSMKQLSSQQADMATMLRRLNHSLPSLTGQVVQATVLHLHKDHVYVDTGYHALSELYKPDLNISHIHSPSPSAPLNTRSGTSDIRVGDVIKVKVEALYTPYGDMQLKPVQPETAMQLRGRWAALAQQHAAGLPVKGRVLNQCQGGYAVGVAGIVGLLPFHRASSVTCQRIGVLQSFYIDRVDQDRQLLVLVDARMAPNGLSRGQRGPRSSRAAPQA